MSAWENLLAALIAFLEATKGEPLLQDANVHIVQTDEGWSIIANVTIRKPPPGG